MAAPRHNRPKAQPPLTFDDRLWPVVVALLVLSGFGAAVIAAVADFNDRRWWANGWTILASLGAVTLVLIVASCLLKRSQRVFELAAVLSVILHILLCLSLSQYRLLARLDARLPDEQNVQPEEEFRAPDYHIRAPEDAPEAFEQPLEATPPEERPTELERRDKQQPDELPVESRPAPVEGPTPDVPPSEVPLRELIEAAPRLAADSAQLSRAEPAEAQLATPAPVDAPELPLEPELEEPPAEGEIARQEIVPDAQRPESLEEPTSPPETSIAELSRRPAEPVPAIDALPVMPERAGTPAAVAAPEAELPGQVIAREAPGAEPRVATARQANLAAAPSPTVPGETAPPSTVDAGVLTPRRTTPQPVDALASLAPSPARDRPVLTPQLRAPQAAGTPRAQSGVDEPLEAPVPLVRAPARQGSGQQSPQELGAVRDPQRRSVAAGSGSSSPAVRLPRADRNRLPGERGQGAPPDAAGGAVAGLARSPAAAPVPAARLEAGAVAMPAEPGPSSQAGAAPGPAAPAGTRAGSPARGAARAGLPVRVAAPEGAGGLAKDIAPDVGTPNRRASEESVVAHAGPARLLARKAGGPLAIDGRSREPAAAFARRGGLRSAPAAPGAPSEQTEAAIELGLVFLAKHQHPDGHWSLHFTPESKVDDEPSAFRADTAATGLALLSFLGAGYDHYGGAYADVVQRALDYLVKNQRASGDLYQPEDAQANQSAWLYSHGIASIALCEAYGMTGDRALAEPAQKAIDFIVTAQDPRRGAWRYVPGSGSDTSVSGWQLMALKSGELAGLQVPATAYQRVRGWLDRAQVGGSQYVYNPAAPDTAQQGHGRRPAPSMTAVGLLMRMYTGLNRDDPHMIEGAEYLRGQLPEVGTVRQPARDTYYWYYATQVMFHMRGEYWRAWNARLHPLLVDAQIPAGPLAGSWDPRQPVPDRWGPQAGRIYVTTLNLLSLEVYYRHLPLYESTAK
jgi:hypothetical protein